ncbi:MAG: substrate-binding domain-containing protein [Austwickia sp.]|nr:MAG: substrate-binding domain-containing protein [Austwickia sp.]
MTRRARLSWLAALSSTVLVAATACSGSPEATDTATTLGGTCGPGTTVRVSAPPEIKDLVAEQARAIETAECARYVVTAEAPAAVAQRGLTKDGGPDLWIADSPIWPLQVNLKKPNSALTYSDAFATSPLVLAVPAAIVAQGKVPTGQVPMAQQIAGALPALQLAKPAESASTLMLLMTAWQNTGNDPAAQLMAAKAFVPVARTSATDEQLFERAVPGHPQGPTVFPASEQAMAAFNAKHPDAKLTSLGAVEGLAALKYVASRPADVSPEVQKADDALAAALRSPKAAEAFKAAGFRVGGVGTASVPGLPQDVRISLDAPAQATYEQVTSLMTTLGRRARLLLVIDTSGSMLDPSGYGGSRIELTARAVQTALNFVPPGTEVGMWQMASNAQFGATDYKEVVPMTKISGDDGNLLPAALKFSNGFDAIVPTVRGGTGLYDTISDAYTKTAAQTAPDVTDVVVVLTDGRNEDDPDSISLDTLVGRIKAAKPGPDGHRVRLALAGLGPYSDMAALKTIAAAADGTATLVDTETSLMDVIVSSVIS